MSPSYMDNLLLKTSFKKTNKTKINHINDNHINFEVSLHFGGIWPIVCPCKTTKEAAARDWKEKKDYMKNKKKTLKICFNFHTET